MQVHDRMTEEVYWQPLRSFASDAVPEPVYTVPVMEEGRAALERINADMGLAFDDWDLKYYTQLFTKTLGRDPTNVELFDMAQSNSEHRCAAGGRSAACFTTCTFYSQLLKAVANVLYICLPKARLPAC